MINLIEGYDQKTALMLDEAYVAASPYGFLTTSPKKINFAAEFKNSKKVIVKTLDTSGLGDYDKTNGYPVGSISYIYNEYQLAMDRGRLFNLDFNDSEDAGLGIATAKAYTQKHYVIPETVAYISQKLYNYAVNNGNTTNVSLSVSNVIGTIAGALNTARDIAGDTEKMVVLIPRTTQTLIDTSTEVAHTYSFDTYKNGKIEMRVGHINGAPLMTVNSNLFYSGYTFLNGTDTDQYNGGFIRTAGAVPIQYIVMPESAAEFIKKTETSRTFSPEVNQRLNAWQSDYRVIYDLISTVEQQKSILAGY